MFQRDISYFPSLKEIRDELVLAQIDHIKQESRNWNDTTMFMHLRSQYAYNWDLLFQLGTQRYSLAKPLTQKILSDSTNPTTNLILYLYTMESFIYTDLNRACRNKDHKSIKFYGAFSAALSFIIDNANKNRKQISSKKRTKLLFRGLKMDPLEAEAHKVGSLINLTGYTSTSKLFETAKNFAFAECQYPQIPVILQIHFKENSGFFELTSEFSAYPEEQEVLVQDGL